MAFKMRCPKCHGLDYSVERDNRTFGAVAQAFELVYHCRCGKQMFGEQLVQEYERQKAEYDANSGDDEDGDEMLSGAGALAEAAGARRLRAVGAEEPVADEARRREEEDRRWREKVQTSSQEVALPPPAQAKAGTASEQVCAWPGCEKTRRPNSKYCSRACSNKNARARHKARQKKAKKTKSASL